jgi:hypothetical protein
MKYKTITILAAMAITLTAGPGAARAQGGTSGAEIPAEALSGPGNAGIDASSPGAGEPSLAPEAATEPSAAGTEKPVSGRDIEEPADVAGAVVRDVRAGAVVRDVRAGDWRHAVARLLVLVMFGLKKAREETNWFSGDRAGASLVLVLGIAGGLVTTLYAEGPFDWRLLVGSMGVSFTAAGAYTIVKKIIWPSDQKKEA